MDCRPLVQLHLVEYQLGWKAGCGWGIAFREGKRVLAKVLIPKSHVERLQQAIRQGECPVVPVSPWQWRIIIRDADDLAHVAWEGGVKE